MKHAWIAVAVVAAVLVGTPQLSSADGDGKVLRFVEVEGTTDFVDVGASGPSTGDLFVFDNVLKHPATGRQVGRFVGLCTQLIVESKCTATMMLAKGTIEVAATPNFATADSVQAAVLGGTDAYRGASGQLTVVLGTDANQFTVRLTDDD